MKPYKPILYPESRNEIPHPYPTDCRSRCPPGESRASKQEEAIKLRMDSAGSLRPTAAESKGAIPPELDRFFRAEPSSRREKAQRSI